MPKCISCRSSCRPAVRVRENLPCGFWLGFHAFADDWQITAAIVEQGREIEPGHCPVDAGVGTDTLFKSVGITDQIFLGLMRSGSEIPGFDRPACALIESE